MAATAEVAAIRAFNRFYTARIGVLRDGLLATSHSLPEARVLFELGRRDAMDVADLRRTLELDAGYLSRLLARLEDQRLLRRERSPRDARRQRVALTGGGRAAFATLDERSAAEVGALLDGLRDEDRTRLLEAMRTVREVLDGAPRPEPFVLRPLRPGDLGWVVHRHGVLYAEEYGWDETFEALVAKVLAAFAESHDPRREAGWIAEVAGRPAGSVFCVRRDERTAQLRCLLVEPAARGMGIGGRLVEECVRFARRAGYAELVLWTNDVLVEARRLYERAGFALVAEEPHTSFGHDLVGQTWSRPL
ncbi:MAG TPA: helix-turn-helix domain-containing GNAT family N-acetyltransferase [Solirubrobacteraceae bacterium]|nr:helix-turn-helix domain-containing GNAT family N-acetyltransferase [Solirubrobacteraceae bacterium]